VLDDLGLLTPDLASLGWTASHDHWAESLDGEIDVIGRGRIARVSRGYSVVFTGGDALMAASASTRSRTGIAPATGDFVVIENDPEDGPSIGAIKPRTTELARRAAGRIPEPQVLAANIDHVFVMDSLDRALSPRRIERQLVIAWQSGASPAVILTKADQVDNAQELVNQTSQAVSPVTPTSPGTTVLAISTIDGTGISELRSRIQPGQTVALLGLSGIGKSTLVNELTGGQVQKTGEVRAADRRGRHTTVSRDLLPLPDGAGFIIDTPGIREVGLWQADEGLALTFPEIAKAASSCRFGDCAHENEPGCAVQAGLADGSVVERRVSHWRELLAELSLQDSQLEEFERRSESRDRADADRRAKGERSNQKSKERSRPSGKQGKSRRKGSGSKRR